MLAYRNSQTVFNMGGTVDIALLRHRLAVLLWADIRASMSSSSSENSCRQHRSELIKRLTASGKPARASFYSLPAQQLCVGGFNQLL